MLGSYSGKGDKWRFSSEHDITGSVIAIFEEKQTKFSLMEVIIYTLENEVKCIMFSIQSKSRQKGGFEFKGGWEWVTM